MIKTHANYLIIGFGKAGKTLAITLANAGKQVTLIERSEQMYGGTCINVGCIPTKFLIEAGHNDQNWQAAWKKKNFLTTQLRRANFNKLEQHPNITVLNAEASFEGPNLVSVKSPEGGSYLIEADNIFINTGCQPSKPQIFGIDTCRNVFNSTTIMEQASLPKNIVVVGAGFIGIEMASMLAEFNCKVIMLDKNRQFLPKEDEDVSKALEQELLKQGIERISEAQILNVQENQEKSTVLINYRTPSVDGQTLTTDAILVTTGRTPNTETLCLDKAGVQVDSRGYIIVNDQLRTTSNANIWALGDVNGGPQFTYISLDDYRIVANQILPNRNSTYVSKQHRGAWPTCLFTSPPLSHVGMRENEVKKLGITYKVLKLSADAIPKARILNKTAGFMKVIINEENNLILGCTLFCAEAHELINTIRFAIQHQIAYTALRDAMYTHPSMSEAFNELFNL